MAIIFPEELVERMEFMATEDRINVLVKVFVPLQVLLVVVPKAKDRVRFDDKFPPPCNG